MSFLAGLRFIVSSRLRSKARIALSVYIKGAARIGIGRQCKVHGGSVLDASRGGAIALGDRVVLNRQVTLQASVGHIRLGPGVEINSGSFLDGTGGIDIGDATQIGPGVKIISYQHAIAPGRLIREQASAPTPIAIGKDAWIGANAVVLADVGDGAVIGAGAVVTRAVPAGEIWAGVPARFLRRR